MNAITKQTTRHAKSFNPIQYSPAENRIIVLGGNCTDQALIKRLLPAYNCSFLNEPLFEQQLNEDPAPNYCAIVCVQRSQEKEPIPTHLFSLSKRSIIISDSVDENSIVQHIYSGADYYFDINESERVLNSRFEAALRSHTNVQNKIVEFNPYSFNVATRTLYIDNQKISLTNREFELALYLFSNQGKLIKDSDLLTWVWGLSPAVGSRRINTTMHQVSKKMRLQSASTRWDLKRFYAQGYRLIDKQSATGPLSAARRSP